MSQQPWQSFWQSHTTANSFLHEYESGDGPYGVISDYWYDVFEQFRTDTHIIDLGAGNGALSHLYLRQFPEPLIAKWQNIDFAQIHCETAHARVEHIQADMHNLLLPDNSVHQAVSMYGLEYSDLHQSLPEIARVLVPNGSVNCLMHHPESIISVQSDITINVYSAMLSSDFLAVPHSLSTLSYPEIKQHCLQELNAHLHSVNSNGQEDVKLIGQNVFNILQSNTSILDICDSLQQLSVAMNAQVARLEQQLTAACHAQAFFDTQSHKGIFEHQHTLDLLTCNDSPIAYAFTGIK